MKTIVALLIGFILAAPMTTMGADDIITELHFSNPDPEAANTLHFSDPEKIGIGIVTPYYDLEVQVDGPWSEKAKVIAFRWAHEVKCFDFAHLREHKQFKEVPCQ